MPLFHIVILAIVQGLTEFLPVSSSGHLVLAHRILGSNGAQEDLTMDIAVHVGTLFAVLVYFRRDLLMIAGKRDWRTVFLLGLASAPVVAVGFLVYLFEPQWMRSPWLMAVNFIGFGILLWFADRRPAQKALTEMSWKHALLIGFAQIFSLIPGTSRSGVTMTAGRFCGFGRVEAARFSLILGIVAISCAGIVGGLNLMEAKDAELTGSAAVAAVMAFFAGWGAIAFLMRWLAKATFTPFVIYRVALGILLLVLLYAGVIGS